MNPAQCGECVYVPADTWQTPGQYTAGRCATVLLGNDSIEAKVDIRLLGGPDEQWAYTVKGHVVNGEWFSGVLQEGSTLGAGSGLCKVASTVRGTIYYCSTVDNSNNLRIPGTFKTTMACADIWATTHAGSAPCSGNQQLWGQVSITTVRDRVYGVLSGHDQQAAQHAVACC